MIGPLLTSNETIPPIIGLVFIFAAGIYPVFYSLWLYKKLQREGKIPEVEAGG
jgi:hypothetical protein